jgi:hypothetical protein
MGWLIEKFKSRKDPVGSKDRVFKNEKLIKKFRDLTKNGSDK